MSTVREVLERDPGNLHALCNLAIFLQHRGDAGQAKELASSLAKIDPYHPDLTFKLATTMGIMGEHARAYRLFRRLVKYGEAATDPCLHHYAAVAAFNAGWLAEAEKHWRTAEKLDPASEVPKFYLNHLQRMKQDDARPVLGYHYHLPFAEQLRAWEQADEGIPEQIRRDPLVRSSFFWALRHGDAQTKLQVIRVFGMIADAEVKEALLSFIQQPDEDDYLKRVALFVLRSMRAKEPIYVHLDGRKIPLRSSPWSPNLPVWQDKWQSVMETALKKMDTRYDMIQQHDLETLWVEYLSRVYPNVPKIAKAEGWSAALEYLTAKMHQREISYQEVAEKYGVSVATVSKNVKRIDEVCGLKEKMDAIFRKISEPL